jgi:4-hydroxy-tetrahydrodipicolinate synthase
MSGRFGRVVTAMVTPFRDDLSLDIDEAQRLARHLVDHGSDGIVVCGSTGEGATVTDEEKTVLFRAVKDAVGTDAAVIAGTGTYSTAHSVHLTREAEKAGADGVLVVTPYYNKPPQRALLEHFRAVADASRLPVMLYDIPVRTALKIEVDTLLRAAEHPNIVALKDAGANLSASTKFAAGKPEDFEIYSGNDDETLGLLAIGAVGVVSVAAHVVGERMQEVFAAFENGDVATARAVHLSLVPFMSTLFIDSNPIIVKAAMRALGFKVGRPRPPLEPATPEQEEVIRKALQAVGAL